MELLTENIYVLRLPLKVMSCNLGKVVTVIRLQTGKTLIHSTAKFSTRELAAIRQIGDPGWLVEATNFHDTAAAAGRFLFPDIPYLIPEGFPRAHALDATIITNGASALEDEFEVIRIEGMPKLNEHAVFHRPTQTLILADLLFNLPDTMGDWTKWLLKKAAGLTEFPGQSAYFRHFIKDEAAYRKSIQQLAALDFNKIIVGHGEPIVDHAKAKFETVLKEALQSKED